MTVTRCKTTDSPKRCRTRILNIHSYNTALNLVLFNYHIFPTKIFFPPTLLSRAIFTEELERTTAMDTVQWIMSVGTSFLEAIQLSNDLSHLRTSLPRARVLIDRAEWGRFKDKELEKLLLELKNTTYDSEDLLRKFDDQVLRQKMEDTNRSRAGQFISSSLNIAKGLISGSKTRVKEAQSKLDKVVAEIERMLDLMGFNVEPVQLGKQLMPETSSMITEPMVFGRDEERDKVIALLGVPPTNYRSATRTHTFIEGLTAKRMKGENSGAKLVIDDDKPCMEDPTVLPIVGIGGVGKTTLAQLVYNDSRVTTHFDVRIWVCVSDLFDKRRITKEIIQVLNQKRKETILSITTEEFYSPPSLDNLQMKLMEELMDQKFLLVLDDVWPNANQEWRGFSAPLRYGRKGSMILVTTRSLKVAEYVTTIEPVKLEGLPTDIFLEFFKKCAFGRESPESYPQLQDIGRSIVSSLCGSPLAAKTLGRLLNDNLTEQHWRGIQNNELWELSYERNDILPALQLSYLYLPQELKRCFRLCSIYPKDYSFRRDEIVDIWVSQGFVAQEGSICLEDTGNRYLDDLRSRFLFQDDPKFPGLGRYVMHDLICEMAQPVSVGECFLMQNFSYQNQRTTSHTVRHMSIESDSEAQSRLTNVTTLHHLNKLHSLRLGTRFVIEISWFSQLSNILFLSLKGCSLEKLPEGICVLNHLRCLDISESSIQEVPNKIECLCSLQVLDASCSSLRTIPEGITKLVNLRCLSLPMEASMKLSKISGLGNLSSLRNLSYFKVGTVTGRRIGELKDMSLLGGTLHIMSLVNVQSREEAAEARLVDKQYLKVLILQWRGHISLHLKSDENYVLEGLHPPSGIECLMVRGFGGHASPSWLKPENLPTLKILEFFQCCSLGCLSVEASITSADGTAAGSTGDDRLRRAVSRSSNGIARLPLIRLTSLRLVRCGSLTNVDQLLSPGYLPSLRSIELVHCESLASLPVHNFVGFVCLQDLKIHHCWKLECPREMVLPHSTQRLSIYNCGGLDRSFPGCLKNTTSLTLLDLECCPNMESIQLSSISTNNKLKYLVIRDCPELSSIGAMHALSSIYYVEISDCPKLTQVQQPFLNGSKPEDDELLEFIYS